MLRLTARVGDDLQLVEPGRAQAQAGTEGADVQPVEVGVGPHAGIGRVEDLESPVEEIPVDLIGPDASPDGVRRLDDDHVHPRRLQHQRAGEAGHASPDDHHFSIRHRREGMWCPWGCPVHPWARWHHGTVANEVEVPLEVRVELCHAALQHLARRHGSTPLHIKGLAFEPRGRSRGMGSDADVLVRPSQVRRFVAALEDGPWERRSRFHTGSPFGHAQTYWHPHLGYADIHRFFPGLGRDEETFEVLWSARTYVLLGGLALPVPDAPAQALIFALNEARNHERIGDGERIRDLRASPLGSEVESLVPRLRGEVGWAAALGELGRVADQREHDLWRAVTQESGRVDEWRARVKAQATLPGKILLVLRAPLVNAEHLTNTRGQSPTTLEIGREFFRRAGRAVREIRAAWREGRG